MNLLAEKFHKIRSYNNIFLKIFGVRLSLFHDVLTGFDIVKFDDTLKEKYGNYEDEETSMSDFIQKQFGDSGRKLIELLIKQ